MRHAKSLAKGVAQYLAWLFRPRLPWALAHPFLLRRIRRALASPYRLAAALEQMAYLLSDAATEAEIADAARRYVEFVRWEAELRWHPRRSASARVEGVEHLLAAHAQGRGVVLHFAHHGLYSGGFAAVRRASGLDLAVLVSDGALGWGTGPEMRQHMRVVRRGGSLLYAGLGKEGIRAHLDRGEIVAMASDAPGNSVVTFGRHAVRCSSGAVWSAAENNTPIVVMDTWRDEHGLVLRLSEPIAPADHADPKALLQILMSQHEKAILALPEATLVPTLTWPRADGRRSTQPVRDTTLVVPQPFIKALYRNITWLTHLRVPWFVAERQLPKRTEAALTSPWYDAVADHHMTHLLKHIASPAEIEQAKARFTAFNLLDTELHWHPRRAVQQRVEGVEHLRAAQALGRGVVVSFVHHGHYAGMFGAFKRLGIHHVTVVRAGALGWAASKAQRQHFLVFKRGGALVDAREGIDGFVDRLRSGQVVMIATDVPGSSTVSFAGRQVRCSSGAIWAARAADAPIVTVDTWQTAEGHVVRFAAPLMPDDFDDPQDLLQQVVDEHAAAILAWPEAAVQPAACWIDADS